MGVPVGSFVFNLLLEFLQQILNEEQSMVEEGLTLVQNVIMPKSKSEL